MPPQKISGCLRSLQGCLKYSPPVLHFSSWDPVWSVFWIFLNFNLCWLSRHHEFLSFARLCAQNTHEFLISRTPFNYLKWQFIWRSQTINSHSFTQFFFFFFFLLQKHILLIPQGTTTGSLHTHYSHSWKHSGNIHSPKNPSAFFNKIKKNNPKPPEALSKYTIFKKV